VICLVLIQDLAQQLRSKLFEKYATRFLVGEIIKKNRIAESAVRNPLKELLKQGQSIWLDYIQEALFKATTLNGSWKKMGYGRNQ
jgi:hypothetical protein